MLRRLVVVLLEVALAVAAFAGGAALVRPHVPNAEGGELHAKFEYIEATRDFFNVVFFGSSRVLRGIDTQRFDAQMAQAGFPTHSFNFGTAGTWAHEQDYVLHRMLALEPLRLEWIFYAGRPVGPSSEADHGFDRAPDLRSARGVQWHTPRQTQKVLGSIHRMSASPWDKLGLAHTHLELLARNLTNLGRGRAILGRLLETPDERAMREAMLLYIHDRRGSLGLEERAGRPHAEVMDEVRRDPTHYENWIGTIPAGNAEPVALDEINLDVYRAQMEAAAEQGVELVYFTAPGLEGSPERLRLHEAGILPTVFHFNDPERYPELFAIDHRYDRGHLNDAGRRIFSDLFAEVLLEHMRSSGSDE